MLRSVAASGFRPPVTKSTDGKLWFVTGDGVQVVDPHHLAVNKLLPPVRIEQVKADGTTYELKQGMRLPAGVRDVSIEYTALSLGAPEKVHFRYMLEGQDPDWKEVINERYAPYSNLRPRKYRFRLIACNNSGVWNTTGDTLEFSVDPRFYQTRMVRGNVRSGVSGHHMGAAPAPSAPVGAGVPRARRRSGRALRANCTTLCCRAYRA